MNDIQTTTNMTPIEIALQIDENGLTTAKKLYEFLELETKNYSRWCKTNITDNEFADENTDYEVFVIKEENPLGGRPTQDYKLTAKFAKKLSMTAKNEKGEQARNYFIGVEDKLKEVAVLQQSLSPELQMFKSLFNAMAKAEHDTKQALTQSKEAIEKVESIKEVISLDTTSWREETGKILRKIGQSLDGGQAYSEVRSESYDLLNKRFGVDIQVRLTNKRRRMAEEGASKSKRDKLSYLDVIADDKKLIEGYTAIVKEMAIKYGVA
jgi:anti-repressor protein